MSRFTALALLLLTGSAQASAVLIDFEEFAYQEQHDGISVVSQGYDLSIGGTTCGGFGDTYSTVSADGLFRQNFAVEGICEVLFQMDRSDAGAFAIHSLDLSYGGGYLGYSGTLAGGGTANLNTAIGTGDWLNLEHLQISVDYLGFAYQTLRVDDISVSAVPVPAAVWLFVSALGLLGWVRRAR
jgi:hypothetical protein